MTPDGKANPQGGKKKSTTMIINAWVNRKKYIHI